ncbi:hypothetical protein HDZ31DRAFT_49648 [Schizophyllum fasciatum]
MDGGNEDAAPRTTDAGETLCALYLARHPLDEPFFAPMNLPIYIALAQYGMGPLVNRGLIDEWETADEARQKELYQQRDPAAALPEPDHKLAGFAVRELRRRNALDARAIALFGLVWECVVVKRMTALQQGITPSSPQPPCGPSPSSDSSGASDRASTPPPIPGPCSADRDPKVMYAKLLADYRALNVASEDVLPIRCALPELGSAGVLSLVYGPLKHDDEDMEYMRPVLWFVHRCLHKVRMTMAQVATLGRYVQEEDVVAAATRTFVETLR